MNAAQAQQEFERVLDRLGRVYPATKGRRANASGLAAGLFASWALRRLIATAVTAQHRSDALLAGAVTLLFALVAAAAFVPARRAVTTEPMESLRNE